MRRLTPRQRDLLAALAERGPCDAGSLSGTICTPESAAASLKRLRAKGLVEPETPTDSVSTWGSRWRLTAAGREALGG